MQFISRLLASSLPRVVTDAVKISEMPAASAAGRTDEFEVNQDGTTRRLTLELVASAVALESPYIDARQQFGVVADGATDNKAAIQAAVDFVSASGVNTPIWLPPGAIYISGFVKLRDGTNIRGAGKFATTILHPASHAFHCADEGATAGNQHVAVEDMGFDAGGTYSGALSLTGIRWLDVRRLRIFNHFPTGVTVGIGISTTATGNSGDIRIEDCDIDVMDYGIVIEAGASGGTVENVKLVGNTISTAWGTCISFARNVRNLTIENNTCRMPCNGAGANAGVGFGIKIWQGVDLATGPRDIRIAGNNFVSTLPRASQVYTTGVLVSHWTQSITTVGNTFINLTDGYRNDFGNEGASKHVIDANIFRDSHYGIYSEPSNTPMIVTNNVFEDLDGGYLGPLVDGVFSNNRLERIAGRAIHASLCHRSVISANVFLFIGQEVLFMERNGGTNHLCVISGNVMEELSQAANDTWPVLQLNDQPHIVSGNSISSVIGPSLPSWIVARRGENHGLFHANWLYGARRGYRELTGGTDIYTDNLERGGIG